MSVGPTVPIAPRRSLHHRLGRLAGNPSGAVYGTILTTAIIAATAADKANAGRVAATTVVTLLVFWLAHVYSDLLGLRLRHGDHRGRALGYAMAQQAALLEGPAPTLAVLGLGSAGLVEDRLAINLALAGGVIQLFAWGVVVARRLGRAMPAAIVAGLVDAGFGAAVIGLETLLH